MATTTVPPRTPSPKVRIRSQCFDSSPSSRIAVTPIEQSPSSKSTGAIAAKTLPQHDLLDATEHVEFQPASILLPLHTKMSDESILSDATSASSSVPSSPTESGDNISLDTPVPCSQRQQQQPHPLSFCRSVTNEDELMIEEDPCSPFLYQDKSFPMYSPWLVRAVLDLFDVGRLDWMSIAESIQRIWGVQTSSAEVLGILSDNGRVSYRRWWD
ncbi:hypothetical protein ACEQ8H_004084 [Pleosporales sp. CAS-2024a]